MAKEVPNTFDYDSLLESFRTFLKSQEQFKDYNFDGSGINVILRSMAYNMTMQAYSDNMLFNESFLTTAEKRSSVGSIASFLSYCPRSIRSAKAGISLSVQGSEGSPLSIELNKTNVFTSELDNNTFSFIPSRTYTAVKDANNAYTFPSVELVEGTLTSNTFLKEGSAVQSFVIPNKDIDISTLVVRVYPSSTSTTFETFDRFEKGTQLGSFSKLYFLEMNLDGFYQIEFGDSHLSRNIAANSVVYIEYVVGNGELANGCAVFEPNFDLVEGGLQTVVLGSVASGGDAEESIQSIKQNARFGYAYQDALVTETDYATYVRSNYSNVVKDAIAWGGDKMIPPKNGYVYVSVRTKTGDDLTALEKQTIVDDIDLLNVGTITPVIVDADKTTVSLDISVTYDSLDSTIDVGAIESGIISTVNAYSDENVEVFGGEFIATDLVMAIKNSNKSLGSVTFGIEYHKHASAELNVPYTVEFKFSSEIYPGTVLIDEFSMLDTDPAAVYTITDDGKGILKLNRQASGNSAVLKDIGTVDYLTGKISIKNIVVNTTDELRCTVKPPALNVDYYPVLNEIIECITNSVTSKPK